MIEAKVETRGNIVGGSIKVKGNGLDLLYEYAAVMIELMETDIDVFTEALAISTKRYQSKHENT